MLSAEDLRGLYAIIPTPSKPGADRWDATDTVDLEETARLVEQLVGDGVHGLIVLGTTGECPTLRRADYEAFADCVLSTVARRIPTFVGASAPGLHEVIDRLRFVAGLGADGTLLGLPMWQPVSTAMAVEYYAAVSEAFPELAVMVYANSRAFRYGFPAEFWAGVVDRAPTVTSAKFSDPKRLAECADAAKARVHFLPHDMAVHEFARIAPGTTTACWATAAAMGPEPSLAIVNAVLAGDEPRTAAVAADIAWANEPIAGLIATPEVFASYNIQIEKIRIDAAGYCRAGPIRPPYGIVPDEYVEAARECGRRWAALCDKYREA
jgi:dihydrodipicolinate synthase/N-acetylneuraminate lyase